MPYFKLSTIVHALVPALLLWAVCGDTTLAGTERKLLNPCSLVSNSDVFNLLGWTQATKERRKYDFHGATGAMCFISTSQGQVIVIVPDPGSDFFGITAFNDPSAAGLVRHVYGLGADVTLYNGTVYVSRRYRNVAVRVVPESHAASYNEVEGFAKVVLRHLR